MAWGSEWKADPQKIESYKLTDTVPIDGELLLPKRTIWIEEAAPIPEKVWNNLKPTHDPYTNPNTHIYYQCNCGAILDPGTKSFAALNNAAMNSGWKVRWGAETYVPYCVKCGEEVE